MKENRFGLNRGRMTFVGTKVNNTSQNILAYKISRIFIHWGPLYGFFLEFAHFAPPLFFESVSSEFLSQYIFFELCILLKIFGLGSSNIFEANPIFKGLRRFFKTLKNLCLCLWSIFNLHCNTGMHLLHSCDIPLGQVQAMTSVFQVIPNE